MALPKLLANLNIHQSKPDKVRGQASATKEYFDKAPNDIKTYINDTLTPAIDLLDTENVKKTGDQAIEGVKTFVSSPIVSTPTTNMQASTKKYVDDKDTTRKNYVDGLDAANVKVTGDQNVGGIKTFTSNPIIPAPIENLHPSTKKYVDDMGASKTNDLNSHKLSSDHDGRYYTEVEINELLNLKTNLTGNHLGKWQGFDPVQTDPGIQIIVNEHTSQLAAISKFETAGGTATAITLTNLTLADGNSKTFIVASNNGGAATTVNGKSLYKPNTTTPPNLTAGKAATIWYDQSGDNFFIKASAEGDAIAANVLAGKKFSNDDDTGITGTMTNNGPASAETINLTTNNAEYTIPLGYHSGLRKIKAVITGLIASVIKAGTTVGGVVGTFTSDATASAGHILNGYSAYNNGAKVTGNILTGGNEEFAGWVRGTVGIPSNPQRGHFQIPTGKYYNGTGNSGQQGVFCDDANFIAENILPNKSIFGLAGNAPVKKFASGQTVSSAALDVFLDVNGGEVPKIKITVSGLSFTPSVIIAIASNADYEFLSDYFATGPFYGKEIHVAQYAKTTTALASNIFKGDAGAAYVNSSGFCLAAGAANLTYNWVAFE